MSGDLGQQEAKNNIKTKQKNFIFIKKRLDLITHAFIVFFQVLSKIKRLIFLPGS
jgi:hypothetical protein